MFCFLSIIFIIFWCFHWRYGHIIADKRCDLFSSFYIMCRQTGQSSSRDWGNSQTTAWFWQDRREFHFPQKSPVLWWVNKASKLSYDFRYIHHLNIIVSLCFSVLRKRLAYTNICPTFTLKYNKVLCNVVTILLPQNDLKLHSLRVVTSQPPHNITWGPSNIPVWLFCLNLAF